MNKSLESDIENDRILKRFNDLIVEYRIRYLNIMLMVSILWLVFFLIVGVDLNDIDQKAPRFQLNEGPYRLEHSHSLGGSKQAASSYYRLSANDINIRKEPNMKVSIPTEQLQRAVVIKYCSRIYPKYYFASATYWEEQSQCKIILMQVYKDVQQEKTLIVNLKQINHEIIKTFKIMFSIWCGISFFVILIGGVGRLPK